MSSYSDYRICLNCSGVDHYTQRDSNFESRWVYIDLHQTERGEIEIDGRRYSLASDDGNLFAFLLPDIQSFHSISDVIERASLCGRVEKILQGDEALSSRLDSHCEAFVQAGFTGSVFVEKDGKVFLHKEYGAAADEDAGKSFYIASLSKQFTAAAIMQLVEKNQIDLDESINKYLPPEFQSDAWESVTVHHLLSHQSGIHNFTDSPDFEEKCLKMTIDSVLHEEKKEKLKFEPGSQFDYSNTNYNLLGKIIAHVSGLSYSQFIEERLLAPAEMNSSRVHTEGEKSPDMKAVKGHTSLSHLALKESMAPDLHLIYAAGGIISCAYDLAKWSHVLDGESDILSTASIKRMTTPNLDQYGYGLTIHDEEDRRTISHSGGLIGFSTVFRKYPDENSTIIVLSNNQDFESLTLASSLEALLFEGKMDIAEPVPFSGQDFSDYKGVYQSNQLGSIMQFEAAESSALQILSGEAPPALSFTFPLSNGRVFMPDSGLEFEKQADGAIKVYLFNHPEPVDLLIPISRLVADS